MQFRNYSKCSNTTPLIVALACAVVLLSTTAALAQSAASGQAGGRCSNHTLFGSYGYSSEGQAFAPPPIPPAPFTSTGIANFDGKGGLSWVEHTVIGGQQQGVDWTAANGTYSVNSDCTASMVVVTPNSLYR
jgi:hypothetical protein